MKIFKRFISCLLFIAVFSSICMFSSFSAGADNFEPDVSAVSALLIDLNEERVLYPDSPSECDKRVPPASLTKIMTAMLAIEAYERGEVSLSDMATVSENTYSDISRDGQSLDYEVGEMISFEDLLYSAMVASANESCNVIAEFIAGDIQSFVDLMNTRARELGCTNTHFVNTHGISNDDHYTSANDLALIIQSALSLSLFEQIIDTEEYTMAETEFSEERELINTNKLIMSDSPYYYEYARGIKTGYTEAAGFCLASLAEQEDRQLLCIVLGAEAKLLEDGTTQIQSFSESKRLLEWGFNNFSYKTLLSNIDIVAQIPITLGNDTDFVVLSPESSISELLDNSINVENVTLKTRIYSEETGEKITAPVSQGDVFGEVSVYLGDVCYGTVNLVANVSVELDKLAFLKNEIKEVFSSTVVKLVIFTLILLFVAYIAFIIFYNRKRRLARAQADAIARQRIAEIRMQAELTTGKSFEEIEKNYTKKK